jgi:hypothetical protein
MGKMEANRTCLIRAVVDHVPCMDIGHDQSDFRGDMSGFYGYVGASDIIPLRDTVHGEVGHDGGSLLWMDVRFLDSMG